MSAIPFLILGISVLLVALRLPLLAAFVAVCAPLPALADAAGATTVDLSGIADAAVVVIAGLVAALGRAAVNALVAYLAQKTRLELDDHTRAYLDQALDRAVAYAETRAVALIGPAAGRLSDVDLHSAALAHAVNYAVDHVPDALAHFSITPETLAPMIEARLGWPPPGPAAAGTPAGG